MFEHDQALQEMYADLEFMAWLELYDPDWSSSYSGTRLGLYAAWTASRALEVGEDPASEPEPDQEGVIDLGPVPVELTAGAHYQETKVTDPGPLTLDRIELSVPVEVPPGRRALVTTVIEFSEPPEVTTADGVTMFDVIEHLVPANNVYEWPQECLKQFGVGPKKPAASRAARRWGLPC